MDFALGSSSGFAFFPQLFGGRLHDGLQLGPGVGFGEREQVVGLHMAHQENIVRERGDLLIGSSHVLERGEFLCDAQQFAQQIWSVPRPLEGRRGTAHQQLARVSRAKLLRDKAPPAQRAAGDGAGTKAVKVWSSDPVEVRIRIARPVARFVAEWPLSSNQRVEKAPQGAVDVCARVYGLQESLRWGKGAEVRAPRELRELVRGELAEALTAYGGEASKARENALDGALVAHDDLPA